MHRCRQRLPPFVGSRRVVNAIVVERTALRLAIPDSNLDSESPSKKIVEPSRLS
jgi:hypothetical protein